MLITARHGNVSSTALSLSVSLLFVSFSPLPVWKFPSLSNWSVKVSGVEDEIFWVKSFLTSLSLFSVSCQSKTYTSKNPSLLLLQCFLNLHLPPLSSVCLTCLCSSLHLSISRVQSLYFPPFLSLFLFFVWFHWNQYRTPSCLQKSNLIVQTTEPLSQNSHWSDVIPIHYQTNGRHYSKWSVNEYESCSWEEDECWKWNQLSLFYSIFISIQ